MAAEQAETIRQRLALAMSPMIGRNICTRYIPVADGLVARGTIDGRELPLPDERVIWVRDADGYRVGL
jgi:hypothetical protein